MKDYRRRFKAMAQSERRDWFRIVNKAEGSDDTAYIEIFDVIGYDPWWDEGVSASKFIAELREITAPNIELHINSPGGDVYEGIAIYNALRDHPANIVATVDGIAASAASFIAVAADKVVMNRNSEMMVHLPWGGCIGNADDMREMADQLDKIGKNLASIYATRCGGTVEDWLTILKAETWLNPEEAVEAGLADEIVKDEIREAKKAKNRFDLSVFNHAGREKAPAPKIAAMHSTSGESRPDSVLSDAQSGPQEGAGMTPAQLEQIGLPEDASEDAINAKLAELAALAAAQNSDTPPEGGDGEGEGEGANQGAGETAPGTQTQEETQTTTPLPGSPPVTIPQQEGGDGAQAKSDGTVQVDAATWAQTQAALRDVANWREEKRVAKRDEEIENAVKAGKIPPARREHYASLYDLDPEGTTQRLANLAPGLIPLDELGYGDTQDSIATEDEYPAEWGTFLTASGGKA
jgi:ATP-dependent Clp endopeptidase proteolytic subunit ClpP